MKLPNWLKIIWWLILFGFVTYLMSLRFNSIISGSSNTTDIIIFLIWIALLAIPLFQEVSFFGVGLKKEINDLKSELSSFKSEIRNTISMRAEMSQQINFPLPKDSELADIKASIQHTIAKSLEEHGIGKPAPAAKKQLAPEGTLYLFSVRYAIENELNRITNTFTGIDDTFEKYRPRTIIQMIDFLKYMRLIKQDYIIVLRDVLAICNAAIHGSEISEAKVNFVRDVAPGLIETLKLKADQLRKVTFETV